MSYTIAFIFVVSVLQRPRLNAIGLRDGCREQNTTFGSDLSFPDLGIALQHNTMIRAKGTRKYWHELNTKQIARIGNKEMKPITQNGY